MRFFRPIEYYLVGVDRLRSYHLVVQVDFCVFLELFRVGLIWSQAMGHQCRVMLICSQAMGTPMIYLLMTLKLKHMIVLPLKPSKKRTRNFIPQKDNMLVKAWLEISLI